MFNYGVFSAMREYGSLGIILAGMVLGHRIIVIYFVFEIKTVTVYNTSAMTTLFATQSSLLILIIALLALGISVYSLFLIVKSNKLKTLFLTGKTGQDLESAIKSLIDGQESLNHRHQLTTQQLGELGRQLNLATQKVGLVRFNPFDDGGGNFSFSLALLDASQNGVVITSMHGRQQNRIYTKKIIRGQGENQLTDEEQEAIIQANTIN